jgi:hypothetical protein
MTLLLDKLIPLLQGYSDQGGHPRLKVTLPQLCSDLHMVLDSQWGMSQQTYRNLKISLRTTEHHSLMSPP